MHTCICINIVCICTYALPTFLRSLPIAAARGCDCSQLTRICGAGVMLHRIRRLRTALSLAAVVVREGCQGRERGRVLTYVRATALGDAEVHAQQQASATHRRQPMKVDGKVAADRVCKQDCACPSVRVRYAFSELRHANGARNTHIFLKVGSAH